MRFLSFNIRHNEINFIMMPNKSFQTTINIFNKSTIRTIKIELFCLNA